MHPPPQNPLLLSMALMAVSFQLRLLSNLHATSLVELLIELIPIVIAVISIYISYDSVSLSPLLPARTT